MDMPEKVIVLLTLNVLQTLTKYSDGIQWNREQTTIAFQSKEVIIGFSQRQHDNLC